jgi:hypothetical protein
LIGALPSEGIAVGRTQQERDARALRDGDPGHRHIVGDHVSEHRVGDRLVPVHFLDRRRDQ